MAVKIVGGLLACLLLSSREAKSRGEPPCCCCCYKPKPAAATCEYQNDRCVSTATVMCVFSCFDCALCYVALVVRYIHILGGMTEEVWWWCWWSFDGLCAWCQWWGKTSEAAAVAAARVCCGGPTHSLPSQHHPCLSQWSQFEWQLPSSQRPPPCIALPIGACSSPITAAACSFAPGYGLFWVWFRCVVEAQ